MKNPFLPFVLSLFSLLSFSGNAAVVVTDLESGLPLPKASVFDRNGVFIGMTGEDGEVPADIPASAYPVNIRYVGYLPADVHSPDSGVVALEESPYVLPEIVVDDKSRNMLYVKAYVRDYSSGLHSTDTMTYFSESIVDFMIPLAEKPKYKGWKKSRVLAEREYGRVVRDRNGERRDTLTYTENSNTTGRTFSLSSRFDVPREILDGTERKVVVDGKYGPRDVWTAVGESFLLDRDILADQKNHVSSPALLKLFGMTIDFTREENLYKFDRVEGRSVLRPDMISEAAFFFDVTLKGKAFKWITKQKEPVDISAYSELFVIDRAYLTVDEAKELQKDAPEVDAGSFSAPEGIPPVPAEVRRLKESVIENLGLETTSLQ